jgi:hypothetical protein
MMKKIHLWVVFHQLRMVLSPYIKVKFLGDPFLKTLSIKPMSAAVFCGLNGEL